MHQVSARMRPSYSCSQHSEAESNVVHSIKHGLSRDFEDFQRNSGDGGEGTFATAFESRQMISESRGIVIEPWLQKHPHHRPIFHARPIPQSRWLCIVSGTGGEMWLVTYVIFQK